MNNIIGFKVDALDGECGSVKDLFFDDSSHKLRYLVVDTGGWLNSHEVLISPESVAEIDGATKTVAVLLRKSAIDDSPKVDTDRPISRQYEIALASYHNWPAYWAVAGHSSTPVERDESAVAAAMMVEEADPNLRSAKAVIGYGIQCMEDSLGHVEDLILDTETYTIRYVIVDTRNWLPGGKKVMVSFDWITHFSWADSKAFVDLTQDQLRDAPEYDPRAPVNRQLEERLFDFYGRPIYWLD
jgi:uncharacterized protein YrrD